jgi:hypothetical protein
MFYLYAQKDVYEDWRRRMLLFPLFMGGSMGFAVNNTKAVLEGLFKYKTEFVRTPKYSIKEKKDSWKDKKYVPVKISWVVVIEVLLSAYCLFGVFASFYYLEIAAIPFQILFAWGFGSVAYLSIQQAWDARKMKMEQVHVQTAMVAA